MILRKQILRAHPATMVLASFLIVILAGMMMLKLPVSTRSGAIAWVDALFTATSAVCVTGLTVVDTGRYFTPFGQIIILALIQTGGLGVMTISVALFKWIGRSVSFRNRMAMQDMFAHTPREDIFDLVKNTVKFTLAAEAAGTVLLTLFWSGQMPLPQAIWTGLFHSISAFCNAGFALFPDSMVQYSGSLLLNITIAGLIVTGGIGFPVLYDLQNRFVRKKKKRVRLSIQTKIVLLTSLILIVAGALMFAFLERQTLASDPSPIHRIMAPVFQSITCRTAGFNTMDITTFQDATLTMIIFLMFFGASPGSCGGGVKTTTLALLSVFTISRIKRQKHVNIFKKSIPPEAVMRSVALVLVSVALISIFLFLILVGDSASGHALTRQKEPFLAYLFETVSAFGTVGLSMGITPFLNTWDKSCIILMMIIGRVGVLTFSYIIVGTGATRGVEYSEESMMIG
ncbi:MAG: TrkH family potassium uptake protein [Thermodesulfobacteriota bacterium]|nr:TrkH family potassium uptake protein [Thermodesulfobacteriota bacterium]